MAASRSQVLRNAGNDVYKSVSPEMAPVIRGERYSKAMQKYQSALEASVNDTDTCLAHKNLGMAIYKLAESLIDQGKKGDIPLQQYRKALKHFTAARREGLNQDAQWLHRLNTAVANVCKSYHGYVERHLTGEERALALETFLPNLEVAECQIEGYKDVVKWSLDLARTHQKNREFEKTRLKLSKCQTYIVEIRRLMAPSEAETREIQHLEQDVMMQTYMAESQTSNIHDVWERYTRYVSQSLNGDARARGLERYIRDITQVDCQIAGYMEVAKCYFGHALTLREGGAFVRALYYLHECYTPLEEVKRLSTSAEDRVEAEVLSEDVRLQTYVAESMKARSEGDEMVRAATEDYESPPTDLLWQASDMYQLAVMLTREHELEQEAIALARLGRLYFKVLTALSHKAKGYVKRSIDMALMIPKNFEAADWFKEAKLILKHYQDEEAKRDDRQQATERQAFMKQLEPELTALKKASSTGDAAFLQFVYKTHKPTQEKFSLDKDYKTSLKKAFRSASIHYHPDKVDVAKNGMKGKILHEEISKMINARYESYKGVDS